MPVRHVAEAANVRPDGSLIDPLAVRHGVVVAGRLAALAGPIDPATHLNADFADHGLERCVVVERLEIGSPVQLLPDGMRQAWADADAYRPLGQVDLDGRLLAWRRALADHRTET